MWSRILRAVARFPPCLRLEGNDGKDPRETIDYQSLLVDRWTEVIVKAHAAQQAVKLSVVVPQQPGVAFNRRFLMKDGSTDGIQAN